MVPRSGGRGPLAAHECGFGARALCQQCFDADRGVLADEHGARQIGCDFVGRRDPTVARRGDDVLGDRGRCGGTCGQLGGELPGARKQCLRGLDFVDYTPLGQEGRFVCPPGENHFGGMCDSGSRNEALSAARRGGYADRRLDEPQSWSRRPPR